MRGVALAVFIVGTNNLDTFLKRGFDSRAEPLIEAALDIESRYREQKHRGNNGKKYEAENKPGAESGSGFSTPFVEHELNNISEHQKEEQHDEHDVDVHQTKEKNAVHEWKLGGKPKDVHFDHGK
jgi:hypothetical protein